MTRRITDPRKLADDLIAASDAFIAAIRAAGRAKGLTRRERMLVAQMADELVRDNYRDCELVKILRTRCVTKLKFDPRQLADRLVAARNAAEKPLAEYANAMHAAQFAMGLTAAERKSFEQFAFDYAMHEVYTRHVLALLRNLGASDDSPSSSGESGRRGNQPSIRIFNQPQSAAQHRIEAPA